MNVISKLEAARDHAHGTAERLQAALSSASHVESILLLQYIERAVTLASDIDQLREYILADDDE